MACAGRANASQPRLGAGFAVRPLVYHVHCRMSRMRADGVPVAGFLMFPLLIA